MREARSPWEPDGWGGVSEWGATEPGGCWGPAAGICSRHFLQTRHIVLTALTWSPPSVNDKAETAGTQTPRFAQQDKSLESRGELQLGPASQWGEAEEQRPQFCLRETCSQCPLYMDIGVFLEEFYFHLKLFT